MKTPAIALRFATLLLVLLATACATGPRISSDSDPNADFSRYRTFAFYTPLAMEKRGYATFGSQRAKDSVRRQMESRGYVYSANEPDLWVNINAYLNERTDVISTPDVRFAYYYNYRAGAYFAAPFWSERTDVHRYTEGTLNIDLVDAREKRLVWEGIAVGRMARMQPQERAARTDQTIAEIFAQYPHRAGSR